MLPLRQSRFLNKEYDLGITHGHMFTAALFTIVKTHKQFKCPLTGERIKKMGWIHTMEYYSAIKKDEIMPFAAI